MKLSVVIPVYNEANTIQEILAQVRAVNLADEIIIIDDGSTDGTREKLKAEESQSCTAVIYQARNQGKGAAVRAVIDRATGDIILIQDADLEYDPRDYPNMIRPIQEGRVKVVYGSRFLGPRTAMNFWNMIANKSLTLMTNILYNAILSDMETGYKAFKADVIKGIPLRSKRFEVEPEITAKILKRHHRIFEVPISYYGREVYEGKKIRWYEAPKAIWVLLKYRFVD